MIARVTKDGREQTLPAHTIAVADLAESFGANIWFGRFMRLAGLLHDAGKAVPAFQQYMAQVAEAYAGLGAMPIRGSVTHSTQAAKLIFQENGTCSDPLARLTAELFALVLASHHSHLPDSVSPGGATPLRDRLLRNDPYLSYRQVIANLKEALLTEAEYRQLFSEACLEVQAFIAKAKALNKFDLRFSLHLLAKHLFSCLIDADRYDAYCFEAKLDPFASEAAVQDWDALVEKFEAYKPEFTAAAQIKKLRTHVSNACLRAAQNPPGVYLLHAPTGGGKTLAFLRFALHHAAINKMSRIIYFSPLLSILEQTIQTVRRVLEGCELLEHHSNLLPEEKEEDYDLLAERWDSKLIFTTLIQFLESLYSGSTSGLRKMHHLAGAVLIFDEIQSLPLNCVHLFNGAINYLSKICGATVLLCTATQPQLEHTIRPLLLPENANIVPDVEELFRGLRRVRLLDARIPGGYTPDALAAFTFERLSDQSNGLVILNTRKDALNLYRALQKANAALPEKQRYRLYHLSTSMCPAHRITILNEVKNLLGKQRLILVSTQLIESGVDISFDYVIRALAGLDSIQQAVGRCNRNGKDPLRDCYVVNVAGESLAQLPDIQHGAEVTRQILDKLKSDPCAYGGDPMSQEAMNAFYIGYFHISKEKMDFSIKKPQTSVYNLLSINSLGTEAYRNNDFALPVLSQAFETAGENFYVIEKSIAVLAPYGGGQAIIAELGHTDIEIKRKKELLQAAGRYSITLFDYQARKLEKKGGLTKLAEGIHALSEGCYDTEVGLYMDNS